RSSEIWVSTMRTPRAPRWSCPASGSIDINLLREDDFSAGGLAVELADGNHVLHLLDEIILGEPEQVYRRLTRVESTAAVGDHLHELGNTGDVVLLHLLLHHVGRNG